MLTQRIVFSLCFIASCAVAQDREGSTAITSGELLQHVKFLSSDSLKGRKTGEPGNKTAAEYIAHEFERYGLHPPGDRSGYFQEFPFTQSLKEGARNSLSIDVDGKVIEYAPGDKFRTLPFSTDTSLNASLVFVGYGISIRDSAGYNDYANVDVTNKIVMMLRYAPGGPAAGRFPSMTGLLDKAIAAQHNGASGVIFLTSPPGQEGSDLASFQKRYQLASSDVACTGMSWSDADTLLHLVGKDLAEIQRRLDSSLVPESFEVPRVRVRMQTEIVKQMSASANIVGVLEGADPAKRGEVVVVGAHMDHLGMGGDGSLAPDTVAIHHGADDNASGTAGLLELAQNLSAQRDRLKRSVMFIAFSGEELGLLGSNYYVKHPLLPLDRTIAMVNMDMIGRLKEKTLVVEGMGTSPVWENLIRNENSDSLDLRLKPDGFGPSDHASFYAMDLPVMFFFTNLHSDYHRPSDTWEKINYAGEEQVVKLVSRVVMDVANLETKPAFTKAAASTMTASGGDRQGVRVSLGIVPDYAEDPGGLKISGTRPGSAAEKAGLKGGDIIIKFGGKTVKGIYDFTAMLGEYKPGDEVIIVVKRDSGEVSLTAILEARK